MTNRYLALLRGVNVSGKNPIKMKDFQAFLEENGLKNVTSYIQSGNIIFDYNVTDNESLAGVIKTLIKKNYGYEVPVIVIQQLELENIIKNNPFKKEADEEPTKVLVSFLTGSPKTEFLEKFASSTYLNEDYKIDGRHVYLFCKAGYGKAKLTNNFLESTLKVNATTRNWKTVLKLYEMMAIV